MITIPDRPVHSPAFRRRRALNWLTLGTTYAAMYMGRYNLSFANKSLSDTFGWDKTQIGTIITVMLTIYGVSALFNGPIADRLGGRKAMLIGALGAFFFNVMFGLGAYLGVLGTGPLLLGYLATTWTLNMYFQSYSALSLIKVNSGWFHVTERGIFSVSPLVASWGSKSPSPASLGESWTTRKVKKAISATKPAGMKKRHCHGSAMTNGVASSRKTRKRPLWIIEPKIAENTPRSETWNQPEFTLMSESAL